MSDRNVGQLYKNFSCKGLATLSIIKCVQVLQTEAVSSDDNIYHLCSSSSKNTRIDPTMTLLLHCLTQDSDYNNIADCLKSVISEFTSNVSTTASNGVDSTSSHQKRKSTIGGAD